MALFGKKNSKKTEKEITKTPAGKKTVAPKLTATRDLASVIIKPRVTEKAANAIDKNVYTFEVRKDATKYDVRDAVKAVYNVTPIKVHMVNKKPRHYMSRSRGRNMMEQSLKKAYVYLKEGDRIDLS